MQTLSPPPANAAICNATPGNIPSPLLSTAGASSTSSPLTTAGASVSSPLTATAGASVSSPLTTAGGLTTSPFTAAGAPKISEKLANDISKLAEFFESTCELGTADSEKYAEELVTIHGITSVKVLKKTHQKNKAVNVLSLIILNNENLPDEIKIEMITDNL